MSRSKTLALPLLSLCFTLVGIGMILDKLGFSPWVYMVPAFLGALCIPLALLCLLPLPAPRWANMEYQYMKRHNLLDENGDPLPQSQWPDSEITPADDPEETSL